MRLTLVAATLLALGLMTIGCHSGGTPHHHDRPPQKTSVKIQQP